MTDLTYYREEITRQYEDADCDAKGDFGPLLCYEIHVNELDFISLAEKWGISVSLLGALIYDHCLRLENKPLVNHNYSRVSEGKR